MSDTYVLDGKKVWEVEYGKCVMIIHSDLTLAYLKNNFVDAVIENVLFVMELTTWVIGAEKVIVEGIGKDTFKITASNHVHFLNGMYAHSEFVTRMLKHGYEIECEKEWEGDMVLVR